MDTEIYTCDVDDYIDLPLFVEKRDEWSRCMIGDGPESVYRQIYHLLWNDTVFRTFNEARRLTIESKSEEHGINGPLIRLFDEGFVITQTMSIRRLTDRSFRESEKAVISLIAVMDDIKKNIDLVTRENYVCFDGTPYAPPDFMRDGIAWMHWNRKQANFDKLAGVEPDKRRRSDRMKKAILQELHSDLESCRSVRKYVNKFVAHTSDPKTNPGLTEEEKMITLNKLDECYKAIVRVASFLGGVFLYEHSLGGVPTPQYDQLKNMDLPMVSKSDKKSLYTFWNERCREVGKWSQDLWNKE